MNETVHGAGPSGELPSGSPASFTADVDELLALAHDPLPWWETRLGRMLLGLVPFLVAIGVWLLISAHRPKGWQFAVATFGATMSSLHDDLFVAHTAWSAARVTLEETVLGLLIATALGIAIGVLMSLIPTLEKLLYPIIVFVQAIPKVAFAPILILVFGFGVSSKMVLAAAIAFFPVLVNTMQGMRQVRLDEIDLLRSLGASSSQLFFKVRLRRALPAMFAGLQVGFVFALLGAVVGEFIGGSQGLGNEIAMRSSQLDVAGVYGGLIEISVLGVVITLLLSAISRRISSWQES